MSENKGGQPTKYKPEYCEMLIEHMSQGFSFESFAGVVEVSRAALYKWVDANPEFADAKEIASAKCQVFWENLGLQGMWNTTGEGSSNLNTSAWIFNMKNRFKWRDKQPDENDTVVNNTNQQVNTQIKISPEEKIEIARAIVEKARAGK